MDVKAKMQKLDKILKDVQSEVELKSESQYGKFKEAKARLKLKIISLTRTCENSDNEELNCIDLKTNL
jgi:hypothetical protein